MISFHIRARHPQGHQEAEAVPDGRRRKVVYLASPDASKKWTIPIWNWKAALNRFMIEFEGRLAECR